MARLAAVVALIAVLTAGLAHSGGSAGLTGVGIVIAAFATGVLAAVTLTGRY